MKRLGVLCAIVALTTASYADMAKDLDAFVQGMGYASNTTNAGAYESQAAGLYTGGSLYARSPVRQFQLVQLDLPDVRAGCGGIDLLMGSFSILSEEKLKELGRAIMTNAPAYAADIYLASAMPELKQVRDHLMSVEQMINRTSINSCEASKLMIGGLAPKTVETQQKICHDVGQQSGVMSDYVKARMECSGSGFEKTIKKASENEDTKKQVVYNRNLVWSVMQDNGFLSNNQELAEVLMSLTGTIVIDGQGKVRKFPGMASNPELINAILGTSPVEESVPVWHCKDSATCLTVEKGSFRLEKSKTILAQVKAHVASINDKLLGDQAANDADKGFLSLTSIPVLKFLTVLNSSQYGNAAMDMNEYAELIAHDVLVNYLTGLLDTLKQATAGAEFGEDLVKDIEKRIKEAHNELSKINPKVGHRLKEKLMLIERVARIEKQVANQLNSMDS